MYIITDHVVFQNNYINYICPLDFNIVWTIYLC